MYPAAAAGTDGPCRGDAGLNNTLTKSKTLENPNQVHPPSPRSSSPSPSLLHPSHAHAPPLPPPVGYSKDPAHLHVSCDLQPATVLLGGAELYPLGG